MTVFSRRKTDPRKVWDDTSHHIDDDLIIPPFDIQGEVGRELNRNECLADPHIEKTKFETLDDHLVEDINRNYEKTKIPQCWAFMGTVGGVGTTSLAVQIAYELTKLKKSSVLASRNETTSQICLIDLDFESGSVTHQLDVKPNLSVEDLHSDGMYIDADYTKSSLSYHKSGINVLAAKNFIGGNSKVKTQTILALLDAASELFPYIILDLPSHWQEWSMAAIGGSDFTGLVTDMTIPSLHVSQSKHMQLNKMFEETKQLHIILNKYERRSFKKTLTLSDIQLALGQKLFCTLCNDAEIITEALNCGEPVGSIKTQSRYAKDSRKLLNQILATQQIAKRETARVIEAAA